MNSVRTSETAPRWSFTRDDGTPLNYTLVNIKDWCKNTFEMVDQLRINTDNSHHCYDADRNAKLCTIIQKIAEGLGQFSTDTDALGDAYEYLIGQFAAGSGKKRGTDADGHAQRLGLCRPWPFLYAYLNPS